MLRQARKTVLGPLLLVCLLAQAATLQESEAISVFLIDQDEWRKQGEKAIPAFNSKYTKTMRALLHACGNQVALSKKKEGSAYVIVYRKRGFIGRNKKGESSWGFKGWVWKINLLDSAGEALDVYRGKRIGKMFRRLCQQTDNLKRVKDEK